MHQLVVLDHDGFHRQVVFLLDGIEPGLVARVGQCQHQAVLAPAQRQQAVRVELAIARQRRRHLVEVVLIQIDQRQLIFISREDRHIMCSHGAAGNDLVDQLRLFFSCRLFKLGEQGRRDTPALCKS